MDAMAKPAEGGRRHVHGILSLLTWQAGFAWRMMVAVRHGQIPMCIGAHATR